MYTINSRLRENYKIRQKSPYWIQYSRLKYAYLRCMFLGRTGYYMACLFKLQNFMVNYTWWQTFRPSLVYLAPAFRSGIFRHIYIYWRYWIQDGDFFKFRNFPSDSAWVFYCSFLYIYDLSAILNWRWWFSPNFVIFL